MLAVKTLPRPRKLTASALPAAAVSVRRSASRTRGGNPQPVSRGPLPLGDALYLRSLVGRTDRVGADDPDLSIGALPIHGRIMALHQANDIP
jgi:hypothetical protein